MGHRIYSAVVDPHGVFPLQAQRLVWSLTQLAGVNADDVVLHVVGEPDPVIMRSLEGLGVELERVDPFPGHVYCNKLQQLAPIAAREFDDVVLLDCDVLVLEKPPRAYGQALGKPVDFGNPPLEILQKIYMEADVPLEMATADVDGSTTARANVNGGVYVIGRPVFEPLARAWQEWAEWCLARIDLFEDKSHHVDQVSFSLAVAAEGIPFSELSRRFNLPTHLPQRESLDVEPALLHYHSAVDTQQFLRPVHNLPRVNDAITRVNARIRGERRSNFGNTAFWNTRYGAHPDLGSGTSSRYDVLAKKQNLLRRVVAMCEARSVADVGGGAGRTAIELPEDISVAAFDVAVTSTQLYLKDVPESTRINHNICRRPLPIEVDLNICLDLLIHLSEEEEYRQAISHLVSNGGPILISGFDAPPVARGPMTYFHEPLSTSLNREGRVGIPVFGSRGVTVFLVLALEQYESSRDIRGETLLSSLPLVQEPILLAEAILRSQSVLGFFPDHLPRCIEYPWVVQQLDGEESLSVLDAGTGVSVLPLLLADRGHSVITVDPHPQVRNGTPREAWNEWGFLDYSELHHGIQSLHVPYEHCDPGGPVDVVVSVSVIEHLPADTRRAWIQAASDQLRPGGRLLLTVDVIPFSDDLWGFSEGEQVEEPEVHGSVGDMLQEIVDAGFEVTNVERSSWLPTSRVGMARIGARRLPAR